MLSTLYRCGRLSMYYLRLLISFIRLSAQEELAYRANFLISLLYALLNLGTSVLAMIVLFDGLFQMARYPVGLYPGWVRLMLTWIFSIGIMTTVPAEALSGRLPIVMLAASVLLAFLLVMGASVVFQVGLRRYASASS